MGPAKHSASGPPRISFSSWVLGGPLVVLSPKKSRLSATPKATKVTKAAIETAKESASAFPANPEEKKDDSKAEAKKDDKATKDPKKDDSTTKKDDAKEPNSDLSKRNGGKDHSDPSFTPEQDALLLTLKSTNTSWREISMKMSVAKHALQHRFKELQKEGKTAKYFRLAGEKSSEKDKEMEEEIGGLMGIFEDGEANTGTQDNNVTPGSGWGDGRDDNSGWVDNSNKDTSAWGGNNNSGWGDNNASGWGDTGNSKSNNNTGSSNQNGSINGWGEESKNNDSTQNPKPNHNQVNSNSAAGNNDNAQPGDARLLPDMLWSPNDCGILEMLEKRYTEQKWLSIQAGFYNMTGRMVMADIIERKFCTG